MSSLRVLCVVSRGSNAPAASMIPHSTTLWRTPDLVAKLGPRVTMIPEHADAELDSAVPEELKQLVAEHKPDLVMLKAHGDASGTLQLPNNDGIPDSFEPNLAADGINKALEGSTVRGIVFHACHSMETATKVSNAYVKICQIGAPTDDVTKAYFAKFFEGIAISPDDVNKAHIDAKAHALRQTANPDADSFYIIGKWKRPAPPVPPPGPQPRPFDIERALRIRRYAILAVLALAIVIPFIRPWATVAAVNAHRLWGARDLLDYVQMLTTLVIFVLVAAFDHQRPLIEQPANQRVREAVEQFRDLWLWLWGVWILLYVAFSIDHFFFNPEPPEYLKAIAASTTNILNNMQSGMLFLLFYQMAKPTFDNHQSTLPKVTVALPVIVLGLADIVCPLLFPDSKDACSAVFGVISGILGATCFGLFFARIETKFLKIPLRTIMFLCLYAAIQPLFPIFRQESTLMKIYGREELAAITYILKATALIGKLVLYQTVYQQLVEGRLAYYMFKIQHYHASVDDEWRQFERSHFAR